MCYVKFKETNQMWSPLKINQSINTESSCGRNNKSMNSCFYEIARNSYLFDVLRRRKTEDSENVFF